MRQTIEEMWHEQAEAFKREAERVPPGKEREDLLRKARQFDDTLLFRVSLIWLAIVTAACVYMLFML